MPQKKAEQILSSYFSDLASAEIRTKYTNEEFQGVVTKADIEAERAIVNEIGSVLPDHQFLAEEEHSGRLESDHLWVIDPLDGTNNFAHGIPHFAISIAYYREGVAECGVILNPTTGDLFTTQHGKGSYWNANPVSVNQHASLENTMIAVGFYYDRGEMMKATLNAVESALSKKDPRNSTVRNGCTGSCASWTWTIWRLLRIRTISLGFRRRSIICRRGRRHCF